jgi:hypothetical protein
MKQLLQKGLQILASLVITTVIIWLILSAVYGGSGTPVESSPLYNTPQQEVFAVFVILPIVSFILAVALNIITWLSPKNPYSNTVKGIKRRN